MSRQRIQSLTRSAARRCAFSLVHVVSRQLDIHTTTHQYYSEPGAMCQMATCLGKAGEDVALRQACASVDGKVILKLSQLNDYLKRLYRLSLLPLWGWMQTTLLAPWSTNT